MNRSLIKDFFREIWKTKSRFLSIFAIVALGAGFFAGVNVTTVDMKLTANNYYQNYHLMDYHLVSTYGITEDDVAALEAQSDTLQIDTIMPGYSQDIIVNSGTDDEATAKILSYSGEQQPLNQYRLLEGRMPERPDECVVDTSAHTPDNFRIGETVTVSSGSADTDLEEILSVTSFHVVGIVQTPLYVNYSRGYTSIGNGTLDAFLVVPEEAFTRDVYTDIYLTIRDASQLDVFTDAYTELIESKQEPLEIFAQKRGEIRFDEIITDAQKELEDGKKELADAEETQKKELEKARQKLDEARQQLIDGKAELSSQREIFASERDSGRRQLQDAESALDSGTAELARKEAAYQSAKAEFDAEYPAAVKEIQNGEKELVAQKQETAQQFAAVKEQLDASKADLDNAKTQLKDGQTQLDAGQAKLDAGQSQLDNEKAKLDGNQAVLDQAMEDLKAASSTLPEEEYEKQLAILQEQQAQLDKGYQQLAAQQAELDQQQAALNEQQNQLNAQKKQYETGLAAYNDGYRAYIENKAQADAAFTKAQSELDSAKEQLHNAKVQLEQGAAAITAGHQELDAARAELNTQWNNYNTQIADAQRQLADAEQKLIDGEQELADGEAEYETGKAESDQKLADARQEIADAEAELAALEEPEWYVWTRDDNVGYPDYGNDADRIKNVSTVLPVFFILIAVLVCLTTMTRMVEERRTQIGTMKALGYSKGAIMMKYVMYAALATFLGCVIGLSVGFVLFPAVLFMAYSSAYNIPDHLMPFHWDMAVICTAVGLVCMIAATLFSCYKELYAEPAALMRPKSPPAGKKILLERWTALWNKIPFAEKITLRNLLRYKKRAAMTVVGIAGCTALMLTGFGLQYAITSIIDKQFDTIMVYDGVVSLKDGLTDSEKETAFRDVSSTDGITSQMFARMSNVNTAHNDKKLDAILLVPSDVETFKNYVNLHTRVEKTPLALGNEGVIVSEKLARVCGVGAGDMLDITLDSQTISAPVSGVNENYAGNYVYMSPELCTETLGAPEYNCVLINMASPDLQDSVSTALTKNELIMGSSFNKTTADNFNNIIQNLNSVVLVIIISAGALAFIVLYNLVNISVGERIRELATLKVLGFRDYETSAYIYRENIICTVIGIILGLFGGIFLESFVVRTAEVDSAMFAPEIPFYCFLCAGFLTLAFTLVVNVALHFKLKKLDMVESLKSIE